MLNTCRQVFFIEDKGVQRTVVIHRMKRRKMEHVQALSRHLDIFS